MPRKLSELNPDEVMDPFDIEGIPDLVYRNTSPPTLNHFNWTNVATLSPFLIFSQVMMYINSVAIKQSSPRQFDRGHGQRFATISITDHPQIDLWKNDEFGVYYIDEDEVLLVADSELRILTKLREIDKQLRW